MTRPRPRHPAATAVAAAFVVAAAAASLITVATAGGEGNSALGPGTVTVELTAHYSRFSPSEIRVAPGTAVRFVVHNTDPIDHEFIVGDADVHRRHESGTEAEHPAVPGEVSVPAGETRETTFAFDRAGVVLYACHLPGHFAYGMQGNVVVSA